MTLRGVHYSRVSDPSQVSGASLDQQVAHGVEWFGRKGIDLVRCFREEGESGRSAKRSTLTQALAFIAAEKKAGRSIDVFVIHDLMLTGPGELWQAADASSRRQIVTLIYPKGLTLSKEALRTPEVAFAFNDLGEENAMKVRMVEQTRAGSNPLRDWFEKAAAVVQAVLAPPQIAWGRA